MKINSKNKIYIATIIFLVVCLVFLLMQNFKLQKEITNVDQDFEKVLDDFNLFLIEKVEKCESVMLMVGDKSEIINGVHCK